MVSSLLVDSLNNPTRSLLDLYDTTTTPIDDFPALVSRHFAQIFTTIDAFNQIPILNVNNPPEVFPDGSLVRFRGMIQDTSASPEMYMAKRNCGRCGGWGLANDNYNGNPQENIDYADLRECTVVWAVNVPGESEWCSSEIDGVVNGRSLHAYHPAQPHKFPIPNGQHVGVQIKVYQKDCVFKPTEVVTFVGILTLEPVHSELDLENPTDVPTVHVLFFKVLPPTLVALKYPDDVKDVREELITWLAHEALGGDRVAAELLLLTVIARFQPSTPPIHPPSLTLSGFPSASSVSKSPLRENSSATSASTPPIALPTIFHLLSHILSVVVPIPLSLSTLNTAAFTPESKKEDLYSGWLQLPAGVTAIITEHGIDEGTVNERGITNIYAIQEAISTQTLQYIFPYSQFSFPTDISFLLLCQGRKSAFFQTSINKYLEAPSSVSGPALDAIYYKPPQDIKMPTEETLSKFRMLVSAAQTRDVKITIGEATSEYIQEDFVRERQSKAVNPGATDVTPDDLIRRMMLARLLALSMNDEEVTPDVWERAKALDKQSRSTLV